MWRSLMPTSSQQTNFQLSNFFQARSNNFPLRSSHAPDHYRKTSSEPISIFCLWNLESCSCDRQKNLLTCKFCSRFIILSECQIYIKRFAWTASCCCLSLLGNLVWHTLKILKCLNRKLPNDYLNRRGLVLSFRDLYKVRCSRTVLKFF